MTTFPVGPESVTAEWLGEVLNAAVRAVRLERIGIGVGILGRLYRVHLDGDDVPASVVVKFPTLDGVARTSLGRDLEFYLREVRFYQEIGHDNPLPPARCYFAAFDEVTSDFVLVLEDLERLRLADQTVGCSAADAELVIDAIASQHAAWWDSSRMAGLPWLNTYSTPRFATATAHNFSAGWPRFLDGLGADLPPQLHAFGERFPSMVPRLAAEIARPPVTFLHGDLRLDQLFFAAAPCDPQVTALDWQMTARGRGAYDVGYFISQSLTTDLRRSCERHLLERYRRRLDGLGIDYPADQLRHDYRVTVAYCFAYPVIGFGRIEVVNDRQLELLRAMLSRSVQAIEDHDACRIGLD